MEKVEQVVSSQPSSLFFKNMVAVHDVRHENEANIHILFSVE